MGLPKELDAAVHEVIAEEKWSAYFQDFQTGWNFVTKEEYGTLLQEEGFDIDRIQVVRQKDVFPSVTAFKGFISQWFPYLRPLPEELKDELMDRVLAGYVEREPLDEEGRLHFKVNRLEVVVRK